MSKTKNSILNKPTFKNNSCYMPVTMQQFEDLTNEILDAVNLIAAPNFLNGDYMSQIVMSALHALDHKDGEISKLAIFESCINRISCHVTFHAVEAIKERLEKTEGATTSPSVDDDSEVVLTPPTLEAAPEASH